MKNFNLNSILNFNKLTHQQKLAVKCKKTPILVSASAGSGKTLALCNRILFKILNHNNEQTLQNLLVVSFTKTAADEIFNRLKLKLNELKIKYPTNLLINHQLQNLCKNNVTTIDSFCFNFLKEHFQLAKLAPNFKLGTELEIFELQQNTINELFTKKLNKNFNKFQKLSNYFNLKTTDYLKNEILKLYNKSRTHPFPEQFLINLFKPYFKPKKIDKNSTFFRVLQKEIIEKLSEIKFLILNAINICLDDHVLNKSFKPIFQNTILQINKTLEKINSYNLNELKKTLTTFTFENLPRYNQQTNNFNRNLADFIKTNFFNPAKKILNDVKNLVFNNKQFLNDCINQKPFVFDLINLCLEFSKMLTFKKINLNIVDFSDLILKTLNILIKQNKFNSTEPNLTNLGKNVSNNFSEILIDEFQDINKSQELLFKILSKNGKNLFMVGDVKQSIYRFRQADPQIFLNYRTYFKQNKQTFINLQHNFRSRIEVINSINFLFNNLMTKNFGNINYLKTDALISGTQQIKKPVDLNFLTELHIINNENDEINNLTFEMRHIANQINHFLKNGFKINKNGQQISCEPKHFAVLLRSNKLASDVLVNELLNLNLPFIVEENQQFLNSYEISIVVSLLKILNNPLNDVAFCAVAMSPIFNFTTNELAIIKQSTNYLPFFLAFSKSIDQKSINFFNIIKELLNDVNEMLISQLVQKFYNNENFNNIFLNDLKNKKQILNNLQNFLIFIIELEQNDENLNLNKLLNLINLSKQFDLNILTNKNSNNNQKNAIKITTIHKSKGLEFPIVFIPLCANKFNNKNFNSPLIVSNKLGLGLKHSNSTNFTRYATSIYNCCLIDEKNETKAEELRLLYVAMTRAKDKLILTAYDDENKFSTILSKNLIANNLPKTENSFYKWFLSVFTKNKKYISKQTNLTIINNKFRQPCLVVKNSFENFKTSIQTTNNIINLNLLTKLKHQIDFEIKQNSIDEIAAKMTVSEIVKFNSQINLQKLNFNYLKTNITNSGTATHQFLQHVNFKKAKHNLNNEILKLIKNKQISENSANLLNLNNINKFFNSKIYKLLETADSIYRERSFLIELPANTIIETLNKTPILIKGTVDLIIEKNNELIIVDYKTNKISETKLKNIYKNQLYIYKKAITRIFQKPVTACFIYSFFLNKTIKI